MTRSLSPRREALLKALVEAYLREGEPVGSRLLAQRFSEPLSSATIRNVLAELEEEHLVAQPHTSAGRVPTQHAYRYYVDHWVMPTRPDPAMGERLRPALDPHGKDLDSWLRHATRVMSEVTQGIAVAIPLHLSQSRLVRLEFVPLGANRLVAIWVGAEGEVEHQVLDNPWGLDAETLLMLGNFATQHFLGCTLSELRERVLVALKDRADQVQRLALQLSAVAAQMEDAKPERDTPVVVAGLAHLGRHPEFVDQDRFRELVAAFEEHERLVRLLNGFAEASAADLSLLLGTENPYLGGLPLATAIRRAPSPNGTPVAFAVVQPLRMDYARVLGGLAWWSQALEK